ncbi:hypothetical protein VNI00_008188, partial [Paramarasmius palmivorus]
MAARRAKDRRRRRENGQGIGFKNNAKDEPTPNNQARLRKAIPRPCIQVDPKCFWSQMTNTTSRNPVDIYPSSTWPSRASPHHNLLPDPDSQHSSSSSASEHAQSDDFITLIIPEAVPRLLDF